MSWGAKLDWMAIELGRLSLEAGAVALVVWIVVSLFGTRLSARVRYALWVLVPMRLLLALSFESRLSLFNSSPQFEIPSAERVSVELAPAHYDVTPEQMKRVPLPMSRTAVVVRGLGCVWVAGVLLLGGYLGRQYWLLRRKVSRAQPVRDPDLLTIFQKAQELVGVSGCQLCEVAGIGTPALFGRTILFPGGTRNSREELRCALVHELVHLKRRDHWVNGALLFLQIVHWFNPLVWFAFGRIRAEMEQTCDERVVELIEARQVYCEALVNLVSACAGNRGLLAFSMTARPGEIKERVQNLARGPLSSWAKVLSYAALACIGFFVLTDRRARASDPLIRGVVLDDISGRPVPDFSVETRHNWRVAKRPIERITILEYQYPQKASMPGEFRAVLKAPRNVLTTELRFNAPGYDEFLSITFKAKEVPSHLTVRMHRKD